MCPTRENVGRVAVGAVSYTDVEYEVSVELEDGVIEVGETIQATVSPWAPVFYVVESIDEDVEIYITSSGAGANVMGIASVQNGSCPVYDLPTNVRYTGRFQTMTEQATIQVTRSMFNGNQVYIVLVVTPELEENCYVSKDITLEVGSIFPPPVPFCEDPLIV